MQRHFVKYKKIYIRTALCQVVSALALAWGVSSCSNESIAFKKAEQSYAIGEYYAASLNYKKSYARCDHKNKEKRAVRAFMLGECYRRIGLSQKAVAAYQNAIRQGTTDSLAYLHVARQQLKAGQYKQAAQNFSKYLELDPSSELAHSGLLSCELGPQWKAKPNQYSVKRDAALNSRRADFSPMLVGDEADQMVISSTRNGVTGDEMSGITGQNFGDLFLAKKVAGG